MKQLYHIILVLIISTSCNQQREEKFSDIEISNLKLELQEIWKSDQKYRRVATDLRTKNNGHNTQEEKQLWTKQTRIDSINMTRVESIISKFGYPGKSIVGENLKSVAAYVIIHNPSKQEKYLPLLWDEAKKENIQQKEIAILEDRILMMKGLPQIYGTAMKYDSTKINSNINENPVELIIWEIKNYKNIDKRRQDVGWYSLKKQCEFHGINLDKYPEYKYQANIYD